MKQRIGDLATVTQGPSRSGRAAGAREGDWPVSVISGNNIQNDRILFLAVESVMTEREAMQRHLLKPYDIVVTAKSTAMKAALVPPNIPPAIANSTMLAIRPYDADIGLWIWWYLTSLQGRARAEALMVASSTLWSLSPRALADLEVPVPPQDQLRTYAELIQASELADEKAIHAAQLRRHVLREVILSRLSTNGAKPEVDQ